MEVVGWVGAGLIPVNGGNGQAKKERTKRRNMPKLTGPPSVCVLCVCVLLFFEARDDGSRDGKGETK